MATATYVKTEFVDTTDQTHSIAIVDIDGSQVKVKFWYSLIEIWGKDGVKQYICAEALRENGYIEDAHALLEPNATDGSWQKQWCIDYPIVAAPIEPVVDPLA